MSATPPPAHVRVRIEALVLDRSALGSSSAVARAVETELARSLGARLPGQLRSTSQRDAVAVELRRDAPLGSAVATAIDHALRQAE